MWTVMLTCWRVSFLLEGRQIRTFWSSLKSWRIQSTMRTGQRSILVKMHSNTIDQNWREDEVTEKQTWFQVFWENDRIWLKDFSIHVSLCKLCSTISFSPTWYRMCGWTLWPPATSMSLLNRRKPSEFGLVEFYPPAPTRFSSSGEMKCSACSFSNKQHYCS